MSRVTGDIAALVLRVCGGLIFLPHGWAKVAGDGGAGQFAASIAEGYRIPVFLGHVAAWAEVVGAILLIAGLFTRLNAFLLAATMAVAVFVVLLPDALYGIAADANRFFVGMTAVELPLAMLAVSVALVLLGAGRVSLDHALGLDRRVAALLGKKKAAAEAAAVQI
jgi:putative oxidoreductase